MWRKDVANLVEKTMMREPSRGRDAAEPLYHLVN